MRGARVRVKGAQAGSCFAVIGERKLRQMGNCSLGQGCAKVQPHCAIGFVLEIIGVGGKHLGCECGFAVHKQRDCQR